MTASILDWVINMNSKPAFFVSAFFGSALLLWPAIGHSEVTLDGSLSDNFFVQAGDPVQPGSGFTYDITADLGQRSGQNLFHSFAKFNIDLGQQANFSGPSGINNIVSRITGGESSIAGKVTSNISGASLWLVNPAGFILTNGAVVDVDGTFHLSTADFLEFSDGAKFFSNLSATSTLSTSRISSFGFIDGGKGIIAIDSSRATPGEDKSSSHNLNVNSDFISIQNSDLQAKEIGIRMGDATFGNIDIGTSLLESVEGGIFFQGGNIYAVDSLITASGLSSTVQVRANSLTLEGLNSASAIRSGELGASGGDLDIVAKDIVLKNNAVLTTSSGGGREGGDILLGAETIQVTGNSQIALFAGTGSRAGDININTTDILIQNSSSLNSSSKFQGATAGSIAINATGRFGIESGSTLLAESDNAGIGGSVSVTAGNILIQDGATIDVQARGAGSADTVDLKALTSLTMRNGANINASSGAGGNGGTVLLRAPTVTLDDVDIIGEANGLGDGGDILIDGSVVSIINGSTISVSSVSTAVDGGDAGLVNIKADAVNISDTKLLLATRGGGVGGTLEVFATDINIDDTVIAAEAEGLGSGGDTTLRGDTIDLTNIQINASIKGEGQGGDIKLEGGTITLVNPDINITASGPGAAGDLTAEGDTFFASGTGGIFGDTQGSGVGADILLRTNVTNINDITLTSSSRGNGQAGIININSPGGVTINNARLDSQTQGDGIGGDINIQTTSLLVAGTGSLNVSAFGSGNAGTVDIAAGTVTMGGGASLVLTAEGSGRGGALSLNAESLTLSENATITGSVSRDSSGSTLLVNANTVSLTDKAKITSNTTGSGAGGTIDINTTSFAIQGDAAITAETLSPGNGDAGLIQIDADSFTMNGGNLITNSLSAGAGGTVNVQATMIDISNGGSIKSDSLGAGNGGDINLTATESYSQVDAGVDAVTRDRGNGGTITIRAPEITIGEQAVVNISALSGTGDAGEMTIAGTTITLDNSTLATATFTQGNAGTALLSADTITASNASILGETRGAGEGADIQLTANTISLTNTPINSSTSGAGEGGVITLAATDVLIDGSSIITETTGDGAGGSIVINADQLNIVNRGNLNGRASDGSGNAGDITITAKSFDITQGLITLVTSTSGSGGNLNVNTDTLNLSQANLSASARGQGDAGSISVATLSGAIQNGTKITSDTTGNGVGGDIVVSANTLDILSDSVISSSATGPSDAGDVTLIVPDVLQIVGAQIQTTSAQSGGGSINIQTQNRIRIDNGVVSASANGVTDDSGGGNIDIDPELFTLRQSQIVAQANAGTGGNINLVATNFVADSETLISASSQRGIDGTVEIESPNQAVNPISVELNTGFQDLPEFISNNCASPGLQDRSYLIVENMNPVRRDPADYLPTTTDTSSADHGYSAAISSVQLAPGPGC